MRIVILVVFAALLGYAGYWFWWEDGGGNAPISIDYEIEIRGDMPMLRMMGLPRNLRATGDLSVTAIPNAVKLGFDIEMTGMEKTNAEVIVRVDKQVAYSVLHDEEVYSMKKVKLVPKSKSEKGDDDFDWFDVFEAKVDGKWFGEGGEKYFARKHVIKDLGGMSSGGSAFKVELWFSDDIRLGRRHVGTVNKLLRLDSGSLSGQGKGGGDDKRPQLSKDDFPCFPLPLRVSFSFNQQSVGWFALEAKAKRVSRKRVSKRDFEPPAGYEKISEKEFDKKMQKRFPVTGVGRLPGQ
jgi:hypothetical protein